MRLSLSRFQRQVAHLLAVRPPVTDNAPAEITAAVAILVTPDPDSLLLIRRAERAGDPWSGHMGLPGGRYDAEDPDLLHTAIRETSEEVGVELTPAQLLGGLDDVAPRTPAPVRVRVRPFVFALGDRPSLALSDEVARAIWVDVEELRRPGTYRPYSLNLRGEARTFPAYHIGEHVVWGLTERILTPLIQAIRDI